MKLVQTVLCMGLMAAAPLAVAEEFSNTTKHETLTQAIQFEKYKIAAPKRRQRRTQPKLQRNPGRRGVRLPRLQGVRKAGQADSASKK